MPSWIEWAACGGVLAIVVYSLFDQIAQEAKKEEERGES